MNKEEIKLMISLHKRVDVGKLSDEEWRAYQRERRIMEELLKKRKP